MKPKPLLRAFGAVTSCLLGAANVIHAQTILYVDRDALSPIHDGLTWCSAFVDLQDALDVATFGTVIQIANGVYRPDTTGLTDPREATFSLMDGVRIVGGYAGCNAPDPDERDLVLHETVLSGDLDGDDAQVTLLDNFAKCYTGSSAAIAPGCESFDFNLDAAVDGSDFMFVLGFVLYTDNVYHVVTSFSNSASASLEGCTITGGNATGVGEHRNGGGMHVVVGAPSVTACTFRYNAAANGGGVYNDLNAQSALLDCTFISNFAYAGAASGFGGGAVNWNGQPAYDRCVFVRNGSGNGGGVFTQNSSSVIRHSRFLGNLAATGAGLYSEYSNPVVVDTIFSGNVAVFEGGGIRARGGSLQITNLSLSRNDAYLGGGFSCLDAAVTIDNSVLWGNTDAAGAMETSQLRASAGTTTVRSTCVQALSAYSGNNNIGTNPKFLDPTGPDGSPGTVDDDLHLLADSPCVDAGRNDVVSTTTDLDGNPRAQDGDGDGTATVDMGAYELGYVAPETYFAFRDLSGFASRDQPFTAAIIVIPPVGTNAWAAEDSAPPGWIDVTNIDNGGGWDAINNKVKWGPFFSDQPMTLHYTVTPPASGTSGPFCFSGIVSIDGINQSISGAMCLSSLVPAISEWGLLCVALVLLIAGTLVLRRSHASTILR